MGPKGDSKGRTKFAIDPPARGTIQERLSRLEDRLDDANKQRDQQNGSDHASRRGNAIGLAFRLASELIAGFVVGGLLGWWIDSFFGTTPLFLLIFFTLGLAAGILNVVRTAKKMQDANLAQDQQGLPNSEAQNDKEN